MIITVSIDMNMCRQLNRIIFPVLLLLVVPGTVIAAPDFPAPPEANVEWVGRNMEVNGIRSDIRAFNTDDSIRKVINFYTKEWDEPVDKGLPGYIIESEAMAPWTLISRIEDGYLLAVQTMETDRGGAWGYLSLSPLPDRQGRPQELGVGIPKMHDSHVIQEVKHDDPGKKGRTLVLANSHSVDSNISFYRNHFRGEGWNIESDYELAAGKMHSMVFKSNREQINIMVMGDSSETRIVINFVKNSLF